MESDNKKKKTLFAVYAILALVLVAGVTYAFITIILQGQKENTITGGALTLNLDDSSNGEGDIMIADAFPMSDDAGKQSDKVYTFTLTNSSPKNASYTIYLDEEEITNPEEITLADGTHPDTVPERLENQYVKVYLTDEDGNAMMDQKDSPAKVSELGTLDYSRTVNGTEYQAGKSHVLYAGTINAATKDTDSETPTTLTFKLRMWIADDAGNGITDQEELKQIMGRYYATKISVDAIQVQEFAVTVINNYTGEDGSKKSETKSTAVYYNGDAVFTDLAAPTTESGKAPSVSCMKNNDEDAGKGMVVTNVTEDGKFNLTINDVTEHLVCTVTHETSNP